MASVIQFTDFSADLINFSEVHKNKMGGKAVYLKGQHDQKMLVQLPVTRAPFGLSAFEDKKTGNVSYTVPLQLDDPALQDMLKELDAKILKYVVDNSEALLGKKMSMEVVSELYTPLVRPSKGEYAPQLKLKVLAGRNGEFVPKAYDHLRNRVPLDTLGNGDMVHTIIDINQIWVVDKKFGVSVRLEQVMKAPSTKLDECAFAGGEELDIPDFAETE